MQRIVCSNILGETVVRVGGAVHPVHFATKSCWYWRANLDSVYGLFHRIELFLRDQTVRSIPSTSESWQYNSSEKPVVLVDNIDSRLLGGFADENRAWKWCVTGGRPSTSNYFIGHVFRCIATLYDQGSAKSVGNEGEFCTTSHLLILFWLNAVANWNTVGSGERSERVRDPDACDWQQRWHGWLRWSVG